MNILTIDTSTDVCNVCIADGPLCLAEYATKSPRTHTERLMPAIDLLLSHLGKTVRDVEAIAVINGPGSFTGLRISLSVVKGLALALQCPVIAANALEIAALQVPASGLISPAMDARRGEIFTALYKKEENQVTELIAPVSVKPEQWRSQLPEGPVQSCGPGAAQYWDVLRKSPDSRLWFKDFFLAKTLAIYANAQLAAGNTSSGDQLRAAYLRPSDAETKGPRPNRKPERIPG